MPIGCKCGLVVEGKDIEVPLKESKVHVTLQGFIANVESQLTYTNNGPDPLQTSFVFPMDDMSAVYKFEADVNKKHIIAECQDKKKARETYETAITQGHTAMLLSEDDTAGDIFECKLGNLPAGETALLKMTYVVELSVEPDGKIRFTLPTVLNPRYSPVVGHLVAAGSKPSPGQVDIKQPCKLTFSASISGQHQIKAVSSVIDKVKGQINEDKMSATIDLLEEFKFDQDLSFDVIYEDISKPEILLEPGDPKKDGILKEDVLMLNFYPKFNQDGATEDHKREFIFVIDRSGSMMDKRIQKAKETLLLLLKSLPVGCLFNVVSFGSSYSSLFDKSQEYSEKTLKAAIKLQKEIDANMGGTEILQPLQSIYKQSCKQGYPRQIFLMTDGEVSNTEEVISLVRKHKGNTRVFTFGIGDGVSTSLIKNVAKASNGKATFIKDKDNMQAKVISAMKGSLETCLSEVTLEWNLPSCYTVVDIPKEPPVIFQGEKLVLFALLRSSDDKNVSGSFDLKGMVGDKPVTYHVKIEVPRSSHPDLPLHRMAAKYQIKELELDDSRSYDEDGENKGKIILVSLAANIMSKYTAFVGVDKDSKVPVSVIEEPMTIQYMQSMPQMSMPMGFQIMGISACVMDEDMDEDVYENTMQQNISRVMERGQKLDELVDKSEALEKGAVTFKKKSKLAMPKLPNFFNKKGKTSSKGLAASNMEVDSESDGEGSNQTSDDNMMNIISLQNFDGSWTSTKQLAHVLQVTEKELSDRYKGNIWCTAVVMEFLDANFADRRIEWGMIYEKAMKWMSSQDMEGKTVVEILQEVKDSMIVKVV